MRALFHLLGHADEALALNYASDNTEETVTVAALKLSRLLSGKGINDASGDDYLPFVIAIGNLENKPAAKDWFGELVVEIAGSQVATWHIQTGHSYLNVSNQKQVFESTISTSNPLIIGQMVITQPDWSQPNSHAQITRLQQTYWAKLDGLKENEKELADFFRHANLANERLRCELGTWLVGCSKQDSDYDINFIDGTAIRIINRTANANCAVLIPYATRLLWGMCQVDDGREIYILNNSSLTTLRQPAIQRLISFSRVNLPRDFLDEYSQSCTAYRNVVGLDELNPDFFVHDNRIRELCLRLWMETETPPHDSYPPHPLSVRETVAIFEALGGKFKNLQYFLPRFSKSCSGADVAKIMEFMPRSSLLINVIEPVSPEQFFALVSGLHASCEIDMCNLVNWYRNGSHEHSNCVVALPPTLEECVFGLLEPLARSGKPFEPPFIDFGEEVDLELIYNRLRIIAATPFANPDDYELVGIP